MSDRENIFDMLNRISGDPSAVEAIRTALEEYHHLRTALDHSVIVAVTDAEGIITAVNEKFCEISGYSQEELIGKTHRIVNSGYHPSSLFRDMWQTIRSGKVWEGQLKNKKKDGSFYWVKTTIVPFLGPDGKPEKYISIRTDITKQKETEEQVRRLAQFDELTGLANRRMFKRVLESHIAKDTEAAIAVVFLDFDRFSVLNDTLGHEAGDQVLMEMGRRLNEWQRLPQAMLASRYGGDEFVLLLHYCGESQLEKELREIQRSLAEPFHVRGNEFRLSVSMGVSLYPNDGNDAESLIRCADMAMYSAKRSESGRIYHYRRHQERLTREMLIERSLQRSLEEGDFQIYFQPKVNVQSETMCGMEALIRWRHPELGDVPPSEFIPIAEKTRFIIPLGEWMLRQAVKKNTEWLAAYGVRLVVAVNVSPIQLEQKQFVPMVKNLLQESGMPPELLELEITESVAMSNEKSTVRKLRSLREIGVKISIDDFGTGYSSLNYLRSFGLNTLKIDRAFIQDYSKERENQSLIPGIIAIGHALSMSIVAEGVETSEQLEYLAGQGCDTVQGFVYSPPVPSDAIEKLIGLKMPRRG